MNGPASVLALRLPKRMPSLAVKRRRDEIDQPSRKLRRTSAMQTDPTRRARGAKKIGEILGQTPEQVEGSLGDLAPQLATYVLETIYGEVYQSDTLDSRTRQIVTVAALATLGTAAPQLRTHIGGALRCGVTRQELVEIMMQLVPYVGVAAAINGVAACRDVFAAQDKK
jgi:4-carboxymuconolactone decarboxylase